LISDPRLAITESYPAGGLVRLLFVEVKTWPLPEITRLRSIALYGDAGTGFLTYISDLDDITLV